MKILHRRTNEFLRQLGRFVISWSQLEATVDEAIATCLSDDLNLGVHVTAGQHFRARVDLLNSVFLYRIHDDAIRSSFREWYKEVIDLATQRNNIMHSSWAIAEFYTGYNEKVFSVHTHKFKKNAKHGLDIDLSAPNAKSMKSLVKEVQKADRTILFIVIRNTKQIRQHQRKTIKFRTVLFPYSRPV